MALNLDEAGFCEYVNFQCMSVAKLLNDMTIPIKYFVDICLLQLSVKPINYAFFTLVYSDSH